VADPAFLLDTNILVYLLADLSRPLRARVEQCEPGALVTSTLCVAEAAFGSRGDVRVGPALPFDLAAANRFPGIPFHRGRLDRFIAAHALSLGLVLVTNNERDFADVPGLDIENWTKL
jgi:tRNA(fMet)-specific endonuclease VapC